MKKFNGKKVLKNFAIALAGAIIGYLLYYSVIMEAIPLFVECSGIKYIAVSIMALVISMAGCIAALSVYYYICCLLCSVVCRIVCAVFNGTGIYIQSADRFRRCFFKLGNGIAKRYKSCYVYPDGIFCAKT